MAMVKMVEIKSLRRLALYLFVSLGCLFCQLKASAQTLVGEYSEAFITVDDDVVSLAQVREALEAKFGTPNAARMDWKPTVTTPVADLETAQKLMSFIEDLNEDDDVQRVITNADIADDILAQLG